MDFDAKDFLSKVMTFVVENDYRMTWDLYQAIYRMDPSCFIITSPLHQNSPEDSLHISVSVKLPHTTHRLHFNGYFRNHFLCTNITRDEPGRPVIVRFRVPGELPEPFRGSATPIRAAKYLSWRS